MKALRVLGLAMTLICLLPLRGADAASAQPRTLIAFYDSREEASPRTTQIHRFLEMPANHLGYVVEYRDINAPLEKWGEDAHGIVLWFNRGMEVPDANAFLDWLDAATRQGKKLLILENMGLGDRFRRQPEIMSKARRVLSRIGLADTNRWQSLTYEARIAYADPEMTGFERHYETLLPAYMDTRARGDARSHLKIAVGKGRDEEISDLIVTGRNGGYVAAGYALYRVYEEEKIKTQQWYVDPFLLLRLSFGADALPKPDATTLAGNRIFYSYADGDGWNGLSEIPPYRERNSIAAEVIRKEILEAFPHIPFQVGVITAELDPKCYGLPQSADAARAIFALPNVEASSHTHSHPLFWRFFADYGKAKEEPFRALYPRRPLARHSMYYALFGGWLWEGEWRAALAPPSFQTPPPGRYDITEEEALKKYYRVPRFYACEPFSLRREINDSAALLQALLPAGKSVRLLHWTGDTNPPPPVIRAVREAGLLNIGGGDAHFDADEPSATSIAPLGLTLRGERQIYSANGNENAFASAWSGEYPGAEQLRHLSRMTNTPLRLKPLSVYFHIYAGQKQADLSALRSLLEDASKQKVIPVSATDYAAIANGFYTARLIPDGLNSWRVEERGALSTIRIDQATLKTVDYDRSTGVLGHRWRAGSLYIALDPAVSVARISIKKLIKSGGYPAEKRPYLIESHWQIKDLQVTNNLLIFTGHGYGPGTMRWRMPEPGNYRITALREGKIIKEFVSPSAADGILEYNLENLPVEMPAVLSVSVGLVRNEKGACTGNSTRGRGRSGQPVPHPESAGDCAD